MAELVWTPARARPGSTARIRVTRLEGPTARTAPDEVAVEEPLEIRLAWDGGEESVAVTMRTPGNDFELAAGFLYAEGILSEARDVLRLEYCTDPGQPQQYNIVTVALRPGVSFDPQRLSRHVYTTSSCGVCGKASLEALEIRGCSVLPPGPSVEADLVGRLPERLTGAQRLFQRTGGLHAAGLFDPSGELRLVREDVGRHNAVDKLVGALLLEDALPARQAVLAVSGRASFEIMQKALVAGLPVVVAVGAPSSLAVDLARDFGMTLVGFAREGSFNVYAGRQRIV